MAGIVIAQVNQSMYDVIIQGAGSLEAGMQFAFDNGVSITDVPVIGQAYVVSDAALALGDANVLLYLMQNNVVVGTMADPPMSVGISDDAGEGLADDAGNVLISG